MSNFESARKDWKSKICEIFFKLVVKYNIYCHFNLKKYKAAKERKNKN